MAQSISGSCESPEQQCEPKGSFRLPRREFLKRSLQCAVLPSLASPWLASCGSSSPVPPTPRLASVNNFRDVAGADDATAYRTSGGRKLRRGVVYRSCVLASPSVLDMSILDSLGIATVYDLRTPEEITKTPDNPPSGATESNINLNGTDDVVYPTLETPDQTIAYMQSSYTAFVSDDGIRNRLAQVLRGLAGTPGRHLYHCSGGKDRTGWVTTLLLSIVGVPPIVIAQDYLLTNVYAQSTIQGVYQQTLAALGQDAANIVYPILVADQRYLDAALAEVTSRFGSMASYIADGLGVDVATQSRLRSLLLE